MFISFEGIDASGKSTVIKLFAKYLKIKFPEKEIITTFEPGGSNLKEALKIREILLDKNNQISPYVEMLLFATSRRIHLEKLIWPAIKSGKIVLCDRYIDSSIAYQGFGNELGVDLVSNLNRLISENTFPDLTFFLDIKIAKSFERMGIFRGDRRDRLENRGEEFYKKVIEGYKFLEKNNKNFFKIDGNGSYDDVLMVIIKLFEKYYANWQK
ncbi:dTMP kinase [Mycoplasma flocculare]|uniref:Thymidylate kinase n=2 Tax=Mesomycoplasma flocculare TaxID=2128 RepID=A0A0A8E789_MESFC|nr:dTMP kinase [Mesomycoplasma flocculare]MXR39547.1 dTMP kinase [Mycoplasma sp. MF12]AJC49888.1 thymidylate kinase [Mesomycoplasma flocculare ATCC 27399]ENX51223.1 thymidylate kinase [Mesomycoplasma flocculare ATCC 27716]MXR06001.1 dTMP kinase [Mesomycoplasma flocculare]MXR12367.1 dTMP kinase [Mesomycoplasma flocculare]